MKMPVIAVLLCTASLSASAETWRGREGDCGEYRAGWEMEQDQNGVWTGRIDHQQVGGSCSPATGQTASGEVRAVIAGQDFFAVRTGSGECVYYGQISDDRARGFVSCDGKPTRHTFALRFPSGTGGATQRQAPQRDQDEFLDDPQQFERDRVPRGFGRGDQLRGTQR